MLLNGRRVEKYPNTYKCTACETEYKSELPVCRIRCPKCGSNKHKLIKIGNPKDFEF